MAWDARNNKLTLPVLSVFPWSIAGLVPVPDVLIYELLRASQSDASWAIEEFCRTSARQGHIVCCNIRTRSPALDQI